MIFCLRNFDVMAELTIVSRATMKKQTSVCTGHIVFLALGEMTEYTEAQ